MPAPAQDTYWNTSVARHPGILRAVPAGCRDALDVGCGDGLLARKLTDLAHCVTGLDASPDMVSRARALGVLYPGLTVMEGDFLSADLPSAGFDFVCSVSALHHMDAGMALARMRDLLRPGGTLVVVGLARDVTAADWAFRIAAAPVVRVIKLVRRASGADGMPIVAPQMSYREIRLLARRLLPGVRYRRHLLRRYSLTWVSDGVGHAH